MTGRFRKFMERLQGYGELPCMAADGRVSTYRQLVVETGLWEARFGELGVRPGQVVGLRADYSISSAAALFALLSRGHVAALIPRDRDAAPYLTDACASGFLEISIEGEWTWAPASVEVSHPLLDQLRSSGDAGVVIFTSGTTGKPKAALQGLERLLLKFDNPGRRLRTLAFLLFDHIAGLDTLFYTLSNGGALVVTRSRTPGAICALIEEYRVEVLPASPSFLRLLCLSDGVRAADLSSLRVITYGSEPMDPATLGLLNARFPDLQIAQKYGTTETGSPRTVSRGNDSLWLKLGGQGMEMKVVDGILYLRGGGTILGYLNAPSPMDADGWYCTGDSVDVDGEWVHIRGRESEVINVGGEKVAPSEVEEVILQLDFVREAVVSGEPHVMLGQIVTAKIALLTDLDAAEATKRLRQHCRSKLASYKVPVKVDIASGALTTDRQKVQRRP